MSNSSSTPKPHRLSKEQRLQSYASAHRMLLYLLMALVVLELANIPSWATMPVFIIFLWMDHGHAIVGLQEKGWGNMHIALRLLVDVLPLAAVTTVAFAAYTSPIPTGIAALAALGFYLFNRHRIMVFATQGMENPEEEAKPEEAVSEPQEED